MILACPRCGTNYLASPDLLAEPGRKVRCGKCKHEWVLDASLDLEVGGTGLQKEFSSGASSPSDSAAVAAAPSLSSPVFLRLRTAARGFGAVLAGKLKGEKTALAKALIKKTLRRKRKLVLKASAGVLAMLVLATLISGGVRLLRGNEDFDWKGLIFEKVYPELKFDGGATRLFMEGSVYNTTQKVKQMPHIRVYTLGIDGRELQSWWIDPPSSTIAPGERKPFRADLLSSMDRTIDSIRLEFGFRKESH